MRGGANAGLSRAASGHGVGHPDARRHHVEALTRRILRRPDPSSAVVSQRASLNVPAPRQSSVRQGLLAWRKHRAAGPFSDLKHY